ncbi:MAG: BCD family MFS transporter [Pseudomonadota bacterium]
MNADPRLIGWLGIVRLGLVQASLGSIVVLTTSTLNRVMVVELALPAILPGVLVALHYFVQISRPRFGHGSDLGGRRTPWIIGGMAVLGAGGVLAATATSLMATSQFLGTLLAVIAFLLIGMGVGASGTCLLVLLAAKVHPDRRAAAATITWIMMIAGFAITAGVVGSILDPFSFGRLIAIAASVALFALITTSLALWGIEGTRAVPDTPPESTAGDRRRQFMEALRDVLNEPQTRRFGVFVFVSMLAYSAQDLVLEPFAGAVLGLTPGESTRLGGTQHGGVLVGMLLVAFLGSIPAFNSRLVLRVCMIVGCLSSGALLGALALAGFVGASWPIQTNVFALGVANGAFAVAAIGSMMALVSQGHKNHDGTRMGVWGAAQALAFGLGGILGTAAVDLTRMLTGSVPFAYAIVFIAQAFMFVLAAYLATQLTRRRAPALSTSLTRSLATEAGST